MEQNLKNSRTIVDAYCEQQSRFEEISDKAIVCCEKSVKIENRISEIINIFDAVFKNFYPERKQLGIYLLRDNWGDGKKMKKWIVSESNLPENNKWYYNELCLNNIGFTLLPWSGTKSFSIIEGGRNHEATLYNLEALQDKIVSDALKDILKQEKLDLLNKILEGIDILKYNNKFTKEQAIKYVNLNSSGFTKETHNVKKCSGKYIQLEASGLRNLMFRIMNQKENNYQDEKFNLVSLDFGSTLITEQITDEILRAIEEYTLFLEVKEKAIEEYFEKTKDKFIKELICLNLKGQK